ncbi:MAG: glycosyltransferase family 4 protein [Deltaproteobacteria bacterium]|nr:glycosyltransferase family 4 protein [Deltaproteobacteria bacterium]
MIKIVHLTSVHKMLDPRIFLKECITLKNNGYDVTIVAPYDRDVCIEGVNIKAVQHPQNRFNRMTKTIYNVYKTARRERANLYHFHDPELIIIGLLLKCEGKKVIYDIHEDVPNLILEKEWIGPYPLRKFISMIMTALEKIAARTFNAIVTVTPEIASRFLPAKTIILRNYVSLRYIDEIDLQSIEKSRPVVIFHGTISKTRGIKEIIQSIGQLKGQAELWLFGKWANQELQKECSSLEGWQYTNYFGRKDITEIYGYLKLADIGLHILYNLPHYKGGSATKAFEYMACSIPFITTDNPRNREIYEGCSLYVNPMDASDIVDKITKLLNSDQLRQEMGQRGRQLAETRFSWEKESEKLIELYNRVMRE